MKAEIIQQLPDDLQPSALLFKQALEDSPLKPVLQQVSEAAEENGIFSLFDTSSKGSIDRSVDETIVFDESGNTEL